MNATMHNATEDPDMPATSKPTAPMHGFLRRLGVFGFEEVEPVILAALITADPLLLVGRAGTGKTFLLNSLSEALGLEHRHYNASMISFDDLVGFPMPNKEGNSVQYLPTPATIWEAHSVLVDEINRCRPEHQNRLFSLVHERRIQGMALTALRYRWAAMNPAGLNDGEHYEGCEPLDPALADRFAFVIRVKDWEEMNERDQRAVADPRGEGVRSDDGGLLRAFLEERIALFQRLLKEPPELLLHYFMHAASELGQAGVRISPRRVRQWTRNALALQATGMDMGEEMLWTSLRWSIPQRAATQVPDESLLRSAHRAAWASCGMDERELWLLTFSRATPREQAGLLLTAPDTDLGTLAVNEALRRLTPPARMAFAFAVYPALLQQGTPTVGAEGLHDLGKLAASCMHVAGEHRFRVRNEAGSFDTPGTDPLVEAAAAMPHLSSARRRRLVHLVQALLLARTSVEQDQLPALEGTLNAYWEGCREHLNEHAIAQRA